MTRMPPDDWRRLGQERSLLGVTMFERKYRAYRPGWEHDHCEFCGATFSLREGDLGSGYCTSEEYYWVCATCFADFREEFGWRVDPESSPGG